MASRLSLRRGPARARNALQHEGAQAATLPIARRQCRLPFYNAAKGGGLDEQ